MTDRFATINKIVMAPVIVGFFIPLFYLSQANIAYNEFRNNDSLIQKAGWLGEFVVTILAFSLTACLGLPGYVYYRLNREECGEGEQG